MAGRDRAQEEKVISGDDLIVLIVDSGNAVVRSAESDATADETVNRDSHSGIDRSRSSVVSTHGVEGESDRARELAIILSDRDRHNVDNMLLVRSRNMVVNITRTVMVGDRIDRVSPDRDVNAPRDVPGDFVVPDARNIPRRRRHAEVPHKVTYRFALSRCESRRVLLFSLGPMTDRCRFCLAEFFSKEPKNRAGDRSICCLFGRVNVPFLLRCPDELRDLYVADDARAREFLKNVRYYNNNLAMASFKSKIPGDRNVGQGSWCFHVCGQIYHYTEPIPVAAIANRNNVDYLKHNQYYFVDVEDAIERRSAFLGDVIDRVTMRICENALRIYNPYVRSYFSMGEVIRDMHRRDPQNFHELEISIAFNDRIAERLRSYDLPADHCTEVAALFVGEEPPFNCDLIVHQRTDGNLRKSFELKNLNPLADPMVYPLLFPKGERGYRVGIRLVANPRPVIAEGRGRDVVRPIGGNDPRTGTPRRRNDIPTVDNDDGDGDNDDVGDQFPIEDVDGNPLPQRRRRTNVTLREFYRHRLMVRSRRPTNFDVDLDFGIVSSDDDAYSAANGFIGLHHGGKLFQQYCVDAWVRVEADELWYYKTYQKEVRVANWQNLRVALQARARNLNARVGKITILPSSFVGGERNLQRRYLDAMTLVSRHGKPDLFITFTCNPSWREIKDNLHGHQKWENRPDLVCRVFHAKLVELIDDLTVKQFFGVPLNFMYSIEFQKRGLPHAHILLTLRPEDRLDTEDSVNSAVCAQLPDPVHEQRLYGCVVEHMIHKPCGRHNPTAPCMVDGRCRKFYPKNFRDNTDLRGDVNILGQPEYARPNNGRTAVVDRHLIDNRSVVPFNRVLLLKYNCHLNVEMCGSLKSIRYLHKYIEKGPDYISVQHVDVQSRTGAATLVGSSRGAAAVAAGAPGVAAPAAASTSSRQVPGAPRVAAGAGGGQPAAANRRRVVNWDEISHYENHRYVSSMEACWRLFSFKISDRSHNVVVLPVHLENDQQIVFDELREDEQQIMERANKPTKLVAYFNLNRTDPAAGALKYSEIVDRYSWDGKNKRWQLRKKQSKVVGTLAHAGADEQDRFYLRMLLQHVRGATSFTNLRTIDGVVHPNFKSACRALGLLFNHDEYQRALEEAILLRCPFLCRQLFGLLACMIMHDSDGDGGGIAVMWRNHSAELIRDFTDHGVDVQSAERMALFHVHHAIRKCVLGGDRFSLVDLGLPGIDVYDDIYLNVIVDIDDFFRNGGRALKIVLATNDEVDRDAGEGDLAGERLLELRKNLGLLNPDQNQILANIFDTQNSLSAWTCGNFGDHGDGVRRPFPYPYQNLFFIDGPGGTGKTFLYNCIIAKLRYELDKPVLAVAWTGIAATLLLKGTTVHSAFKLPLKLHESTVPGYPLESDKSRYIKSVPIILWDEAPMSPRLAVEAVDRYLQDLMNAPGIPMGGKIVIFGGDFRQLLPIVPRGHAGEVIRSTLKASYLWPLVRIYRLTENLRVARLLDRNNYDHHRALDVASFAAFLLRVGNDELPHVRMPLPFSPVDLVEIPPRYMVADLDALINEIYGRGIDDPAEANRGLADKAILCPTNKAVDDVNASVMALLPVESRIYFSVDRFERLSEDDQNALHVPLDVLHNLSCAGLPPHELSLKVGCVVVLLRNVDIYSGLCNGTRLRVIALGDNLLRVQILTGGVEANRGGEVFLPRMNLTASENITFLPGVVHRTQFPVRVAFAMTINKAQGQTLQKVGIYLEMPCFAHGQLYVALSRVGCPNSVKVFMKESAKQGSFRYRGRHFTRNVVYPSMIDLNPLPLPPPLPQPVLPPPVQPLPPTSPPSTNLGGRSDNADDDDDDGSDFLPSDFSEDIDDDELNRIIDVLERDHAEEELRRRRRAGGIVISTPTRVDADDSSSDDDDHDCGGAYVPPFRKPLTPTAFPKPADLHGRRASGERPGTSGVNPKR